MKGINNMDIKRLMSGILGLPLVLAIFLIGNKFVVDIALTIIALLAMNEYFNAVAKVSKPVRWIGYVSCFIISIIKKITEGYLIIFIKNIFTTVLNIIISQIFIK